MIDCFKLRDKPYAIDARIPVLSSLCDRRYAQRDASSAAELTGDIRTTAVKRQDALDDSQAQA
jgi:hypothetical protein